MTDSGATLIEISNLSVEFQRKRPRSLFAADVIFNALRQISFNVVRGRTLGIVGESGSGKTTLARALIGLQAVSDGSIHWTDTQFTRQDVQFVFQDPIAALNPRMNVEQLILEPLRYRSKVDREKALNGQGEQQWLQTIMQQVGLDYARRHRYAHEFSGGQCQRIGIARAMITRPRLLICDEPVSALDVSIRAQIINLLRQLQQHHDLTMIFIAHDLSLVRFISDDLLVMYRGELVEQGETITVFSNPAHPYTQTLIATEPRPDPAYERSRLHHDAVSAMAGTFSELACAYASRCQYATDKCKQQKPDQIEISRGHKVTCFFPLAK